MEEKRGEETRRKLMLGRLGAVERKRREVRGERKRRADAACKTTAVDSACYR